MPKVFCGDCSGYRQEINMSRKQKESAFTYTHTEDFICWGLVLEPDIEWLDHSDFAEI